MFSSKEYNGESGLLGKPTRHEYASNSDFSFSLISAPPSEQPSICATGTTDLKYHDPNKIISNLLANCLVKIILKCSFECVIMKALQN